MPAAASATVIAPAPPTIPAKRRRAFGWGWAIVLPVVLVLVYPHKDGGSICEATRQEVARQVPYSVDILASRHPIKVGLLRSALNGDGAVDRFAENYVLNQMVSSDPGVTSCYISYYAILFNKDRFRASIADWFEKQLDLN